MIRWIGWFTVSTVSLVPLAGCQLLVPFDESKLDGAGATSAAGGSGGSGGQATTSAGGMTAGGAGGSGGQMTGGSSGTTTGGDGGGTQSTTETGGSTTRTPPAAIAFDSSSTFSSELGHIGGSTSATATWLHTTSGENRLLVVGVGVQGGSTETIASVQYGESALAELPGIAMDNVFVSLFYLLGPTAGENEIVVTLDDSGFKPIAAMAISYTGVLQAGFPWGHTEGTGASNTAFVLSESPEVNGSWLLAVAGSNQNAILGVGANTTLRQVVYDNGNVTAFILADSNGPLEPGTHALELTSPTATTWAGIIVGFAPEP